MSEYLFEGKLRSPDELIAIATYRAKEIAYLKADLKETVSLKYHDDLMHEWKVSEVAKDNRIADLEAELVKAWKKLLKENDEQTARIAKLESEVEKWVCRSARAEMKLIQ